MVCLATIMVFNAASINMCQPIDLEIPFPVNMPDSFAIEYFSFVAQAGTFEKKIDLHKSKMNSGRHFDHFSFEPLVLECRIIPLL